MRGWQATARHRGGTRLGKLRFGAPSILIGVCSYAGLAAALPPGAEATFPGANGSIAFSKQALRPSGAYRAWATLWRADPYTGHVQPLTRVPSRCRPSESWQDAQPAYSPTGRRLAFLHYDDCGKGTRRGIYVMRADGSRRVLIVRARMGTSPGDELSLEFPTWSADGRRIAFTRTAIGQEKTAIFIASATPRRGHRQFTMRQHTSGWRAPPDSRLANRIGWGPARSIAFSRMAGPAAASAGRLHIAGPGDGRPRRLPEGFAPDWSPDARRIAFNRTPPETVCGADLPYISRLRPVRATASAHERAQTAAAPIFRAADAPCDGAGAGPIKLAGIYVVRSDGRELRRVAAARGKRGRYPNDAKRMPTWSPDGRQLAFIWNHGRGTDLYLMPATGGPKRRLVQNVGEEGGLSWQARPRPPGPPAAPESVQPRDAGRTEPGLGARRGEAADHGAAGGVSATLLVSAIAVGLLTLASAALALSRRTAIVSHARQVIRALLRR